MQIDLTLALLIGPHACCAAQPDPEPPAGGTWVAGGEGEGKSDGAVGLGVGPGLGVMQDVVIAMRFPNIRIRGTRAILISAHLWVLCRTIRFMPLQMQMFVCRL